VNRISPSKVQISNPAPEVVPSAGFMPTGGFVDCEDDGFEKRSADEVSLEILKSN
jgi:hypothetical protein